MTWNSSSIPTVKLGRCMPYTLTVAPFIFSGQFPVSSMGLGFVARSISMSATVLQDPIEVLLADREQIAVGGRVHEVDRVRDAVAQRELDRVEVVPQRAAAGPGSRSRSAGRAAARPARRSSTYRFSNDARGS